MPLRSHFDTDSTRRCGILCMFVFVSHVFCTQTHKHPNNNRYEGQLVDAFEKSKKKETIQNSIAVAGGIRDAASSTVKETVLESRSFPLIRYTSSEAEIIVPLASNSRQSLSLVCDSYELDRSNKKENNKTQKRNFSNFILLNRDRHVVFKSVMVDFGSILDISNDDDNDDAKKKQEDVSTKEHHHHHKRRRSSFNLDEFEDVDSDFEEDEHEGFESVDDDDDEEEENIQDKEATRKIMLTCARVAKLAVRDAHLASQQADRALDTLLGRERIMYDADVYVCVSLLQIFVLLPSSYIQVQRTRIVDYISKVRSKTDHNT